MTENTTSGQRFDDYFDFTDDRDQPIECCTEDGKFKEAQNPMFCLPIR